MIFRATTATRGCTTINRLCGTFPGGQGLPSRSQRSRVDGWATVWELVDPEEKHPAFFRLSVLLFVWCWSRRHVRCGHSFNRYLYRASGWNPPQRIGADHPILYLGLVYVAGDPVFAGILRIQQETLCACDDAMEGWPEGISPSRLVIFVQRLSDRILNGLTVKRQ